MLMALQCFSLSSTKGEKENKYTNLLEVCLALKNAAAVLLWFFIGVFPFQKQIHRSISSIHGFSNDSGIFSIEQCAASKICQIRQLSTA
jgi:hypothetical protein